MADIEERGPGPDLAPADPDAPADPLPPAPAPLATELGRRVPDWAPIAAVILLVVLGVAALLTRVF